MSMLVLKPESAIFHLTPPLYIGIFVSNTISYEVGYFRFYPDIEIALPTALEAHILLILIDVVSMLKPC